MSIQNTREIGNVKVVMLKGDKGDGVAEMQSELDVLSARVDSFEALPDGATTADAELVDIRVGADGTTYSSAGNAVRGQFSNIKTTLKDMVDVERIENWVSSYKIWTADGSPLPVNSPYFDSSYRYAIVPCKGGDAFTISGLGSSNTKLWSFTDSEYNVITQEKASITRTDEIIIAPPNSSYLVLNNKALDTISYKGKKISEQLPMSNATLKTKTKTLKDLISPNANGIANGKMNNIGNPISNSNYLASRTLVYAKAGSTIQLPPNNSNLLSFGVAIFDSSNNLIRLDRGLTEPYVSTIDGYMRVDLQFAESVTHTKSDLFLLKSCIIQDYSDDNIIFAFTQNDLVNAFSTGQRIIYLMNDITLDMDIEPINAIGDFILYGNGHILKNTNANAHSNYIYCSDYVCEFHDLRLDGNDQSSSPIKPTENAIVKFYNCEFYNCKGDGIAPSQNSKVYVYDCKIHDCEDEGFSSHDTTYCELHNCEVYHNGYIPYTDTPSEYSTYGGIHLGGTHQGIVKGCYSHHNRGGGISLCPLGQGTEDPDMRAYIIDNVINDNNANGIRVEGLFNCRILGNVVCHNGWGGIRVWVAQNSGVTATTSGIIASNPQSLNATNTVVIDTGADGGITVVD